MSDTDFRLPDTVKPKAYRLRLDVDLDGAKYEGEVDIDLDVRESTDKIVLNAAAIEIDGNVEMDEKKERATVTLDAPLEKGDRSITLKFRAPINEDMRGFYKSTYAVDGEKRTMATTQFEAASARRCFPCWDEPERKATFEVEMTVPHDRQVISNTDPVSEEITDTRKKVTFAKTPVMSTYLLAFIIGEFDKIEGKTKDDTPVRVFTMPGKSELGRFALETAIRGIDFFSEYYDIPYSESLAKCDNIGIPDFEAGAMENWGAITYREVALFVDPERSSIPVKRRVAEVVLHELAHQWFGNLVTMKWWSELWLNESFATFMAYKAADNLFPEWHVWEEYVAQITSAGKSLDSLKSSHPVEVPVRDANEVDQIFDAISYNKGGSLLRMLEASIGQRKFRDGIRIYLKKHRYGNAATVDLWNALSESSEEDVASIMANWTGKTGYPVVIADRRKEKYHLRQERFFLDRNPALPDKDPTVWNIPGLLQEREGECSTADIKLNTDQAGFFLVHYDSGTRKRLTEALSGLKANDRYGLIEDALALTRAGYLSVAEYLDLAGGYAGEDKYHVWAELAQGIGLLSDIFVGDESVPKLEAFGQKLFRPIVEKIGWEGKDESSDQILLRTVVLGAAARFGDPEVLKEAKRRFESDEISADLRGVVYRSVARHGDEAAFAELSSRYEKAELPEVKVALLRSLSGFRDAACTKKALDYAFSDKVRSQDVMYVFAGTIVESRHVAWKFMKDNWKSIDERFGKSWIVGRLIEFGASGIPEEAHAKDVESFFQDNPAPYASERIKQTLEGIRARAKFRKRNGSALKEYFA